MNDRSGGYVLLVVATALMVIASLVLILFKQLQQQDQSQRTLQTTLALQLALEAGYAHNRRILLDNTSCTSYSTAGGSMGNATYSGSLDTTSGPSINLTVNATDSNGGSRQHIHPLYQYGTLQSAELPAVADAFIEEDKTDHNHGTDDLMKLKATDNNKSIRALLRFDVSSIPSNSRVESGILQLYLDNNKGKANDPDSVYRISRAWEETEVTWVKPTNGSISFWLTPGGEHNAKVWGQFADSAVGIQKASITRLVQVWVASGNVHGLLLKSDYGANSVEKKYATREAMFPNEQPLLEVKYRCLCGTSC